MRLIDADELLIAMDTWDKFGYDEQGRLIPIGNKDERYVPYVHYADMVKAVNGMPTIDARADERKKILDILKTYTESDYNSKECKLLVSDLREVLWEGEQKDES